MAPRLVLPEGLQPKLPTLTLTFNPDGLIAIRSEGFDPPMQMVSCHITTDHTIMMVLEPKLAPARSAQQQPS